MGWDRTKKLPPEEAGLKGGTKAYLQKEAFLGLNQWPGKACLEEEIMERAKEEPVRLKSVAERVRFSCAVAIA